MKTIHVSRTLLGSVLAGLVFLSGAASAYTLSFSPSTQNVGSGSSATVDVRIAGIFPGTLNEDDGLGAYDFDVVYDPAIIRFKKATDGFSLGTSIGLGVDDNGQSGRLTVSDFSLDPCPTFSFGRLCSSAKTVQCGCFPWNSTPFRPARPCWNSKQSLLATSGAIHERPR